MRFVLAIVAFVIALGLGGYGVAQLTVLSGPDELTAVSESTSDATVSVIDGETLNALEGRQDLTISGSDAIFAAYGTTTDVTGWVGEATHNRISYDPDTRNLVSVTETGPEAEVPTPAGSDLWLREFTGEGDLDIKVSLDTDMSVIIVSDGVQPAPSTVSITWPLDNRSPWVGPLLTAGAAMLLLSLIFLVWAIVHRRRAVGPRRTSIKPPKNPKMPRLPRQRSYRVRKPKAIKRGRRSISRMTATVPFVLVGTLALSGCSADLWPDMSATSTAASASPSASPTASPSPSASASASASPAEDSTEELPPPATTARQVESILRDVAVVAEAADAALDTEGIKARFAGPALDLRAGNYAVRAKDSAAAPPVAIPTGDVRVTLPQQAVAWPRSIFAVVESPPDDSVDPPTPSTVPPMAFVLVQESAREQYKVNYAVSLESNAELPKLAADTVGAPRLAPDTKLLSMPPGELAAAYVDVLNLGADSASYGLFDIEKDGFIPVVGKEARDARIAALDPKAKIEFSITPAEAETYALGSNEAGALVTAYITQTETVTPVEEGATINPELSTKTLSGLSGTTKGVTASYSDQLLFYIPPIGSDEKIVLLGYTDGLVVAKEI